MIKISRKGISFNYCGDTLLRRWPWSSGDRYSSSIHACDFNSLRDYWWHVGGLEARLSSSGERSVIGSRMYEVLAEYCKFKYPNSSVVVLYDIDCSQKDSSFWSRIPSAKATAFAKDVVFLQCKDREQMLAVMVNTPTAFATALAVEAGVLVDCNQWSD